MCMINNLENKLKKWSAPLSVSEDNICATSIRVITEAINASNELKNRDIRIIKQGSYANNTNVRNNSDVDIAIICRQTFFYKIPPLKTKDDYGIQDSTYSYDQFKMEVFNVLARRFNISEIKYGNKSLKISHFKYGDIIINADVVPFFEYKEYDIRGIKQTGVSLYYNGSLIVNYPEQHISNSKNKNNDTNYFYKKMVRCFKALKYDMEESGFDVHNIKSFVLESILFNLSNDYFNVEKSKQSYVGKFLEPYSAMLLNCIYECKNLLINYSQQLYEPNMILKLFSTNERNPNDYINFLSSLEQYCFGK